MAAIEVHFLPEATILDSGESQDHRMATWDYFF